MKTVLRQSIFMKMIVSTILIYFTISSNGQTASSLNEFEITISSYNFPMRPFGKVVLKNNELIILKEIGLVKDKDFILFAIKLKPTDTLKLISEINFDSLKNYYSNNCIDDGSRINVILKKDKDIKSILLDNYYQEDIGTIIYFINTIVPAKYKIWYDKERLITDYKNCKSNN